MSTAFNNNKESKSILSYNTLLNNDDVIKTYTDAINTIKKGDIIYAELKNSISYILIVNKIANYQNGLAFYYDIMLNRFNNIYKDKWCYCDYCRLATDNEIKILKKRIK